MKLKIYSVKDIKVGYNTPFFAINEAVAKRMFHNAVNDSRPNSLNQNPQDMELYYLGSFDDQSGMILNDEERSYICCAMDCITITKEDKDV